MPSKAPPAEQRREEVRRRRTRQLVERMPDSSPEAFETAMFLGRRIKRFGELTSHPLFGVMYGRLLARRPAMEIVRYVKEHAAPGDKLAGLSDQALERRLLRFRAALPATAFVAKSTFDDEFRRNGAGVDVLDELDALIRYQKDRIERFREQEKAFPVPVEQQRREVLTMAELLKQRRETAIALGVMPGMMSPTINASVDARSVSLSFGEPRDDEPRLSQVLSDRPALIPKVMRLLDEIDVIEGQAREVSTGVVDA